jgi:hypothetical protein
MKALTRHLMHLEMEEIGRMRDAYQKPSTPESLRACEAFLKESQKNPMLLPSKEVQEEMDRILYKMLYLKHWYAPAFIA